jgi:hypothetical protein
MGSCSDEESCCGQAVEAAAVLCRSVLHGWAVRQGAAVQKLLAKQGA